MYKTKYFRTKKEAVFFSHIMGGIVHERTNEEIEADGICFRYSVRYKDA